MRIVIALATYFLIGTLRVWLDDLTRVNHPDCVGRRELSIISFLFLSWIWPWRAPLQGITQILWIVALILIVWVSFLPSHFPFLAISVAIILGSLIYTLWGQNVKQMIRLLPEEMNKPILNRTFLRAYRIFMLVVIPGLPIYFITLKLIGVINWPWWWVLSPLLLIYAPFLLFSIVGGIWDTYRQLKAPKKDEGFSSIAEQIAERHNKYGVTLTDPRTGEDLLAGMTNSGKNTGNSR